MMAIKLIRKIVEKTSERWKKKAIERGKEVRKLRKKIKRIEKSRDNWKKKLNIVI